MEYTSNPYDSPRYSVAALAAEDERASFIAKTYIHLVGAIAALVALEAMFFQTELPAKFLGMIAGNGNIGWLVVLGGFMGVSWLANNWASSSTSTGIQYAGLSLYVVAESIILMPILYLATTFYDGVLSAAAITTLALFGILTAVVFITRKDFSFLRSILMFGGFAAIGLIICAVVFNFSLGPVFTYAMIAFACGYILYDTSNVLHHYRVGQHVAASLALFASVVLLFWYILRLFMSNRD
ncbi:MAG: US12 family protein [Planctomycetales bacterium]|nr:US12 family protein [Planctomycetales bacterium]